MFKDPNQIEDFFGLSQNGKQPLKDSVKKNGLATKIRLLPKILSKKERYLILAFTLIILGSIIALPFTIYYHYTTVAPDYGGRLTEGIVGEPHSINPLLSPINDADRALVSLIYSCLLQYNPEGKLVPDLAKSYDISSDGLTYTFSLNENAKWHDLKPITADDVVFTIRTAQNPDYGSLQRINWQGVDVEKVNDHTVSFKLKNKYAQFLNNLTLGILPQHIWEQVKPINFSLSEYNVKPIGSGPHMFRKYKKDALGRIRSYELASFKEFYNSRPYINEIEIKFYDSEDEMISEYNHNAIQGMAYVSPRNLTKVKFKQRLNIHEMKLPRYFGVFFNDNQNKLLADKNIRLAMNYATNKEELVSKILNGKGSEVYSPLIEGVLDIPRDVKKYSFNLDQAKTILTNSGWGNPDEKGILSKGNQKLAIKVTTSTWPELTEVAHLIKEQWAKAGIDITVESLPTSQLQASIKERSYQALLFGEILNIDPDPFSLWHSSQKKDPGLNLSIYENKTADKLLEEARQTINPLERIKKYDDFQKIAIEDAPAVFLYTPVYLYAQSRDVNNFKNTIINISSDRFSDVEHWYIETERVFD